jgi:hypothetical protein
MAHSTEVMINLVDATHRMDGTLITGVITRNVRAEIAFADAVVFENYPFDTIGPITKDTFICIATQTVENGLAGEWNENVCVYAVGDD